MLKYDEFQNIHKGDIKIIAQMAGVSIHTVHAMKSGRRSFNTISGLKIKKAINTYIEARSKRIEIDAYDHDMFENMSTAKIKSLLKKIRPHDHKYLVQMTGLSLAGVKGICYGRTKIKKSNNNILKIIVASQKLQSIAKKSIQLTEEECEQFM